VLVLSQYIETTYTARLLEGNATGAGYLLKERVADVAEFADALERVAAGGTALDPEVVGQLLRASRHVDGLAALTARERHVLGLMAEGRSNAAIAGALVVTGGTVEKHVASIFDKLGCPRTRPTTAASSPSCAISAPSPLVARGLEPAAATRVHGRRALSIVVCAVTGRLARVPP
jgi:DNA-binding NarL/FixJ family response regulator